MNSADPRPASAGFEHGRLPEIVVARIEAELGASGKRAVNALRTAAHLIALAREDDSGLRPRPASQRRYAPLFRSATTLLDSLTLNGWGARIRT